MTTEKQSLEMSWPTRIAVFLVLAVAIGMFAAAGLRTDSDPDLQVSQSGSQTGPRPAAAVGVQQFFPFNGAEILGQQPFGIDLEPGWLAELVVIPTGGTEIPLPPEQLDVTRDLGLFMFQPGEGKAIERLEGGGNCVRATIWSQIEGREASERVETWCFSVL